MPDHSAGPLRADQGKGQEMLLYTQSLIGYIDAGVLRTRRVVTVSAHRTDSAYVIVEGVHARLVTGYCDSDFREGIKHYRWSSIKPGVPDWAVIREAIRRFDQLHARWLDGVEIEPMVAPFSLQPQRNSHA